MTQATLVLLATSFRKSIELVAELRAAIQPSFTLEILDLPATKETPLAGPLLGAEAVLIGGERFDRALLEKLPALKLIAKYGVGLDNIDLQYCQERRIKVHCTAGVNASFVAEHSIGLMLACLHHIARTDRLLRGGVWLKDGGSCLVGKHVAIIGCGHIGSAVAKALRAAFLCDITVVDIRDKGDFCREWGLKQKTLEQALANADIVSMHVPLTPETKGMVNQDFLSQMKEASFLINTSRGEVVDERALQVALEANTIAGAALDVYEKEPLATDHPFCKLQNMVLTPHIAANSKEAVLAMGRAAISGILDYINEKESRQAAP